MSPRRSWSQAEKRQVRILPSEVTRTRPQSARVSAVADCHAILEYVASGSFTALVWNLDKAAVRRHAVHNLVQ